jgi:hypothetical protein
MTPDRCQEALCALSGGTLDGEAREHLASCARCRKEARVLALLESTRPEPASDRMTEFNLRVTAAHWQQTERARRAVPRRTALLAGACAAAAAVLVGVGLDLARLAPSAVPPANEALVGATSNSRDDSRRVTTNAAARPHAIPTIASRRPYPTNARVTSRTCAPSAIRIPISRVRCVCRVDSPTLF